MNYLNIELKDDKTAFRPNEEIQGRIKWQLDNNPEFLELSLFWHTQGPGQKDLGIAETLKFNNPGSSGNKDFNFKLPTGPYSFSGNLFSIIWNIELATSKRKDAAQKKIIISPTQQIIACKNSISDSNDDQPENILSKLIEKLKLANTRF